MSDVTKIVELTGFLTDPSMATWAKGAAVVGALLFMVLAIKIAVGLVRPLLGSSRLGHLLLGLLALRYETRDHARRQRFGRTFSSVPEPRTPEQPLARAGFADTEGRLARPTPAGFKGDRIERGERVVRGERVEG